MQTQYSLRSPAVKRLMREAQELQEATETYFAHPLEDNLFEWHFTIRGPEDTEFDGGIYHGRIILPPEYPMKPPSIILLTPNGRFEIYKKICLSISGHHPESWQPSWSIRTALLAIIGFMPTHGNGAIGSLNYTPEERKVLARRSLEFKCSECGPVSTILKPVTEASKESNREAKQLAQQINFQAEKEKKKGASEETKTVTSGGDGEKQADSNQSAGSPATQNSPTSTAPVQLPRFPPMGFPPFMQQAFRPPVTSGSNATNIPPQFFMPPFWPGGNTPQQQPNAPQRMPNPFWPPGFMMPQGMVPPPTRNIPAAPITSLPQQQTPVKSSQPEASTSSTSLSSASSSGSSPISPSSRESTTPSDEADRSETSQSSLSSSSVGSSPSATSSASTTTAEDTAGATVRQRNVPQASVSGSQQPSRSQQPLSSSRGQRTQQSAEFLAHGRSGRSGCIGFLMVVIGLALALLVIRRLYMMKLLDFDFNF